MRLRVTVILAAAMLTACATYQEVPEGYAGPIAVVADTFVEEGRGSSQVFTVVKIDGNKIPDSVGATARTSTSGLVINPTAIERSVRARPMKVTLKAQHMAAALQGFALLAQGKFYYSFEGEADFNPKPGGKYLVKGSMTAHDTSIWLEDSTTGEAVTSRLSKKAAR